MKIAVALIPLLPLLGFIVTLLFGKRCCGTHGAHPAGGHGHRLGRALRLRLRVGLPPPGGDRSSGTPSPGSPPAGSRSPWGFQVDTLTGVMLLVVGIIGMLVHYYSIGYMHGDEGYYRFFAYLNLFMFAMFMLILADNYLLLFLGWEGVGLCSYLLIGFWFRKKSASQAGKKAFLVNRVGDFGFTLGMFADLRHHRHAAVHRRVRAGGEGDRLGHADLDLPAALHRRRRQERPVPAARVAARTPWRAPRRSAPSSTPPPWSTPASTWWRAPTRCSSSAHTAMLVVMIVGTFTAIFAAYIAITQNDIKKVIAYSTVSSLGFMFMALGAGAWAAGIFYLFAHGFFKGLLFLCSGSVIHAMGGEQDMRKMGGLRKKIPVTFWTMLIGALALVGIFPFAGFWAKDEILGGDLRRRRTTWCGRSASSPRFLTAFYMFRLIFLTFFGESRADARGAARTSTSSPQVMTVPLMLLAIPAALLGLVVGLAAGERLDPRLPRAGVLRRRARGVRLARRGRRCSWSSRSVAVARRHRHRLRGCTSRQTDAARPPRRARAVRPTRRQPQQVVHGRDLRRRAASARTHRLRRLALDVLRRQGHRRRRQRRRPGSGAGSATRLRPHADGRVQNYALSRLRRHARARRRPRLGLGELT